MRRFLILFALITYSVVGRGGTNKSVKTDIRPGDIEKDREECIQSINLIRSQTFTDCLTKKGYTLRSTNHKWKEWWSKHEKIRASLNPYVWADVILTMPILLTIRMVNQLKVKESPSKRLKLKRIFFGEISTI